MAGEMWGISGLFLKILWSHKRNYLKVNTQLIYTACPLME